MRTKRSQCGAGRRNGKVAVLVAVAMPTVLIPLLALGTDGGVLMEGRRKLQAAADAAAVAGVLQYWKDNIDYKQNSLVGPSTAGAKAAALAALAQHGYSDANCEVRNAQIPAKSANPTINNKYGTVEVLVTANRARGFSALWSTGKLKIGARAVARGQTLTQRAGILVLEDHDDKALYGGGSAHLLVDGAGIVVNSDGDAAAYTNGNEIVLAAADFDVTGGYYGTGFYGTPYPEAGFATPTTGSPPTLDPLAKLPEPNPADYPIQNAPPNGGSGSGEIVLEPGRYTKSVFYSGQRTIRLNPGFYYFERGFELAGGASMIANGVCLYNAGSGNNSIKLAGGGTIVLSPMTTGVYAGISVFQSRNSDPDTLFIVQGNGDSDLTGTFYMPTTRCQITGTGDQRLGSQYICRTLEVSGSGTFTIDFNAARAPLPPLIELVE